VLPHDLIKVVLRNLNRIRVRTVLTTIGVIIGVAAIVTLLSIAFGFQENITESLEGIGDVRQITVIQPIQGMGMRTSGDEGILDEKAIQKIEKIEGVMAVVPYMEVRGTVEVGRYITSLSITGIDPEKAENLDITMKDGRFFRRKDRDTMIVGYNVHEAFVEKRTLKQIESIDLLGQKAEVKVKRFNMDGEQESKTYRMRIIGIIEEQGTQDDYNIYIPLETAIDIAEWEAMQTNIIKRQGYQSFIVQAEDSGKVNDITMEITDLGFLAFSFKQIIDGLNEVFTLVEVVFLGIGAIALIVAALGIINTMLMSILERTREIGIMKVIGASNTDVTRIFLMEALGIGLMGGIGGVGLGYVVAHIIDTVVRLYVSQQGNISESLVVMPLWLVGFAIAFAMMVGLISGVYPARKAARLSPVEALRHQ
jgi:putative ABC transport system permease protein